MLIFFTKKNTAKVELSCEDGKLFVNLSHDLGEVEETTPQPEPTKPLYNNVLKKSITKSQVNRLQKRANARAEEVIAETKVQQEIAENAKTELKKLPRILRRQHLRLKKPKN